jgi:hypothetical protein
MKTVTESKSHCFGLFTSAVILVTSVPAPLLAQLTQPLITAIRPQSTSVLLDK